MLNVLSRRDGVWGVGWCVSRSPVACALLFFACSGVVVRAERIIYVNASALGANDGTSWSAAYADLQDALDDAKITGGCPCEIWVAAGTYKPDRGSGDQTLAFELANNIGVYGGFGGWEECRDQRDPRVNESILNGDLNDDDDPAAAPTSGCCFEYAVCEDVACRSQVIAVKPDCAAVWRPSCVSLAMQLCCHICRPTRCDNTFNVVVAIDTDATPVLDGLTIAAGEAVPALEPVGVPPCGGLYADSSWLTVSGCTFRNNTSGMCALSVPPTISDTLFVHNGNRFFWGAALYISAPDNLDAVARVRNCTFLENSGSGIETFGGNAPFEGCKFIRNRGSGIWNYGYAVRDIIDCTFIDNKYSGMISDSSVRLIGCRFFGNSNPGWGGGVQMAGGSTTLINCVFAGNRARDCGAFAGSEMGVDRFTNCTVVENSATRYTGGISSTAVLKNCILWGNADQYGSTQYSQVSAVRADYSIIQGWTGSTPGTATTSLDPLLMDPLGPDGIAGTEDDDLRLSAGSPAINAGDPNPSGLPLTDLDGHARVLCGRADIGAYEFGIGDFNCDYRVNFLDSVQFPGCMTGPSAAELGIANSEDRMTLLRYRMASPSPQPSALEGKGATDCEAFDFDGDGDVDLADFAAFSRVLRRLETFDGVKPWDQP